MESSTTCRTSFAMRSVGSLVLAIALSLLCGTTGWAHKVNVFAYVEGDTVVVEGYFSGKVKAQNSPVEVFDSNGKKILEGKTDKKGIFRFKVSDLPPVKGDIKIVLEGGMGHKADFTLRADEMPRAAHTPTTPQEQSEDKATESPVAAQPSVQAQDPAVLRKLVEEAVDKKIQPLVTMLGNQQKLLMEQKDKGPTLTEILGGIGWILGIVGIAGYIMGRNRPRGN